MFRNNSLPENPDSDQSISDEDEDEDGLWPENFVSLAETSNRKKENPDSDQSISDEDEDVDGLWPANFVSLAETSDPKKKGMGIASQLELLEGVHQVSERKDSLVQDILFWFIAYYQEITRRYPNIWRNYFPVPQLFKTNFENDVGFFSDDEVEAPDFDEKPYLDSPSREVSPSVSLERDASAYKTDKPLSNDEGSRMPFNSVVAGCTASEILDRYARGKQIQSAAVRDGRKPIDKYNTIGCRPMEREQSSSHCQEHKKEKFWSSVREWKGHNLSSDDDLPEELETGNYRPTDISAPERLGCPDIKQRSVSNHASPVETDIQHERSRHSMVELLNDLQGKRRNSQFKCKMGGRSKGKMRQRTVIKSVSSSGKDVTSEEEPSDAMDSGSSTDNEDKAETPEQAVVAVVESKRKSMAEKFQEAIGSSMAEGGASFTVLNKSSSGVFARLQRVLQRQKDRDTEYFKHLQNDIWPKGEAKCLDVKIMSRSYDAKLIVCQCSLLENEESSLENPRGGNFGKIWSIIFSPRVCGDVDLDVANLIRIHPPWKEVQALHGGEIIILATHYSQIST